MSSLRVAIFEPDASGHRLHHVRLLAEAVNAMAGATPVTVTSDAALHSEPYQVHLAGLRDEVRHDVVPIGSGGRLGPPDAKANALIGYLRENETHHVIVPYADGLTQCLGLRALQGRFRRKQGVEIEGLLMRGLFAYAEPSGFVQRAREAVRRQAWLRLTAAAPLDVVHWLDPIPYREIASRGGGLARRSALMPEPVEAIEDVGPREARERLGLPVDGRLIGCVGGIDRRKGCDRLIEAFAVAKLPEDVKLVLVGKHEPAVADRLRSTHATLLSRGQIISIDRYLSDADFDSALCAVDVLATVYPRHVGSSGLVVRAAAAGRTVLSSDWGWLGWAVTTFGLGTVCDARSPDAIARAMPLALARGAETATGVVSADAAAFASYHTVDNFVAHWTRRLHERIGTPPPRRLEWSTVESLS